jgi:hypothetical protein
MDSGDTDGNTVVCGTTPRDEKPMAAQVAPKSSETEAQAPTPPPLSPTETNANGRADADTDTLMTCESTDKLLATDDNSQGTMSQDDDPVRDAPMDQVREQEADAPEPPRFVELPTGGDIVMDGDGDDATVNDETVSIEATTDTEAEVAAEHPALEHERRWFSELPAFVKRVYADQPGRRKELQHPELKGALSVYWVLLC